MRTRALCLSHVHKTGRLDEESLFLNHLEAIGQRISQVKAKGAAAYLYNLKQPVQ
jgi:hypothetical protein